MAVLDEYIPEEIQKAYEKFKKDQELYQELGEEVSREVREKLIENDITFQEITSRVKDPERFLEKSLENRSLKPKLREVTDKVGIRVVLFTHEEAERAVNFLYDYFNVIIKYSEPRKVSSKLHNVEYRVDKIVAKYRKNEVRGERSKFKDRLFEIQVGSIIDIAWSEIEHNHRNNFFGMENLPEKIQRRFYLSAASLEFVGYEIDRLSDEIEKYREDLAVEVKNDNLEVAIEPTSLAAYLNEYVWPDKPFTEIPHRYVKELLDYGYMTIADLAEDVEKVEPKFTAEYLDEVTLIRFLRDVMILADSYKYFIRGWNKRWHYWDTTHVSLISEKKLKQLAKKNKFELV